jgi:hypothetical protein
LKWYLPYVSADCNFGFTYTFHLPHSCYIPRRSHPSWLDHCNYTWRRVQVMKLTVCHCCPSLNKSAIPCDPRQGYPRCFNRPQTHVSYSRMQFSESSDCDDKLLNERDERQALENHARIIERLLINRNWTEFSWEWGQPRLDIPSRLVFNYHHCETSGRLVTIHLPPSPAQTTASLGNIAAVPCSWQQVNRISLLTVYLTTLFAQKTYWDSKSESQLWILCPSACYVAGWKGACVYSTLCSTHNYPRRLFRFIKSKAEPHVHTTVVMTCTLFSLSLLKKWELMKCKVGEVSHTVFQQNAFMAML